MPILEIVAAAAGEERDAKRNRKSYIVDYCYSFLIYSLNVTLLSLLSLVALHSLSFSFFCLLRNPRNSVIAQDL